jgi:hypothetical protein
MQPIKTLNEEYLDSLETIAEEIRMCMGLNVEVVDHNIQIDTIAGKMNFIPSEVTVMGNVYRCVSNYGSKLHSYGLKMKIKEMNQPKNINL